MKINMLTKRFDGNAVFYAPELKLPEANNVAEACYPAVRIHASFPELAEYFLLLESEVGEYEEHSRHPDKGHFYKALGGKEEIERRFLGM